MKQMVKYFMSVFQSGFLLTMDMLGNIDFKWMSLELTIETIIIIIIILRLI